MDDLALTLRERTPDDRDALRVLCGRALATPDGDDPDGLDRVLWSDGIVSIVAEVGGVVVGLVAGSFFDDEGVPSAAVTVVAVDEQHRGAGIGRALLDALETRARERGATALWSGGGQPRFWWPGIDDTRDDLLAFFGDAGYELADVAPNMDVDLTRADLAERPMGGGIRIHRLQPGDHEAFFAWMDQEWADPWGGEAQGTLVRSPVSCHVALLDGEFVGFAAYDTNRRGWFGPMGATPRVRGSGLGAELLRRCLRDYVEQGLNSCEIGWIGPAEFYAKTVGAVLGRRFLRLRKTIA